MASTAPRHSGAEAVVGTTTPLAAHFQPTLQRASPHPPPNGTRKKSLDPGQPLPPSLVLRSWRPDAQAPNFSIPWSRWGIWLQAGSPAFARELRTFFHRIVKKVVRFAPRPHASPNRHQGAKPGTTRPYDIVRVWSSQTCFAPPVRDRRLILRFLPSGPLWHLAVRRPRASAS